MAPRKKTAKPSDQSPSGNPPLGMNDVERWIEELDRAKTYFKSWYEKSDTIISRYKAEDREDQPTAAKKGRRYNALWATVQTLKPLVYSTPPTPYVDRRHSDKDPAARDAGQILERSLKYCIDNDELDDSLDESCLDYLLVSRGQLRVRYSPVLALRESDQKTRIKDETEAPDDADVKQDEEGSYYNSKYEEKVYEECNIEHVLMRDYLHQAAAKWRHVTWQAFRVPMTRRAQIERFGKKMGSLAPLTLDLKVDQKATGEKTDDEKGLFPKSEIWEIWDKNAKKVYWLCPDFKDSFLDEREDPLQLQGFFPAPLPAYGTKTNESLIAKPDYIMWQDVAMELDDVTFRISLLTDALRVAGAYDKSAGEDLKKILTQTRENQLVPIDNWAMFAEKGGIEGLISWVPIEQVSNVLKFLYEARQRLVQELYEITGMSDILRGATDARETAAAQKIKGNFANKRLSARQKVMTRQARETLDLLAQIICKHYSDETIMQISSAQQLLVNEMGQFDQMRWVAALRILRSDVLRGFRIKVNERSLANDDLETDRTEIGQFIQSAGSLIAGALPVLQANPAFMGVIGELLMMGARSFPKARSVEQTMEEAIRKMMATPTAPPADKGSTGAPPITPEELAIKHREVDVKFQDVGVKKQALLLQEKIATMTHQLEMLKAQMAHQTKTADIQVRAQKVGVEAQNAQAETQIAQQDMQHTHQLDNRAQSHDERMAHVDAVQASKEANQNFQLAGAEMIGNRQDAAADRQMTHQHATADRQVSQQNAAADRQMSQQQADHSQSMDKKRFQQEKKQAAIEAFSAKKAA